MKFKELKLRFEKIKTKYKLPSFTDIDERFELDRIERDTDFILRGVRKIMMDKIIGYIRFLEMMISPSQAPPMFMMFIRNMTEDELGVLQQVYKALVDLELISLKLEIDYDEKEEATAIKNIFNVWEKQKPQLRSVLTMMEKNWNSTSPKKDKAYFG